MGRKKKDLTNMQFGKLTAIESIDLNPKGRSGKHAIWRCRCECGNFTEIASCDLQSGRIKSCGCLARSDLTGQRSGLLTAIEPTNKRKRENIIWLCRCDCGSVIEVRSSEFKNKSVQSCGCLKSKMELKTMKYLKQKKVIFKQQFNLPGTKMRFDFMILDSNNNPKIAIECQGRQHMEPVTFNGISKRRAEQNFISQQKRDNYKRKWCAEQGIPLIEIPYNDFNLDKYFSLLNNSYCISE
jgi:hypothetical protein